MLMANLRMTVWCWIMITQLKYTYPAFDACYEPGSIISVLNVLFELILTNPVKYLSLLLFLSSEENKFY